jgi:diguanylate cyclase (GGDEF)-like protein
MNAEPHPPKGGAMSAGRLGGALVCAGSSMTLLLGLADAGYSNGRPVFTVVPSLVGLLLGLACIIAGPRTPPLVLATLPSAPGLLICLSMWATNTPLDGSELLLVWCIFFAGYLLPAPAAAGNAVVLSASYAVAVIGRRGLAGLPPAIELATTLAVACLLLSLLRRRAAVSLDEARADARTDPLTGLLNRRGLAEALTREVARAARDGRTLTLWMVDLDHFKGLNDSFGHAAGDSALKTVADLLRRELRSVDVISRFGGEEFCVVLPSCTTADAFLRAEAVRETVAEEFRRLDRPLTISIGVASWSGGDLDGTVMMADADEALYAAKFSGRNRSQVAHGVRVGRRTTTEVR